mmetsp:Transcript_79265/g.220355  ORF Transcript_79265/g.220355 Transcript_79265/m.220355 type:complete len:826 (-) Transcript_79265:47-2524(-)
MGRSESARHCASATRVKAVSGTHVVVLVWDLPDPSLRRGLLGFAIRKSVGGRQWWLPSGGRRFGAALSPGFRDEATEEEGDRAGGSDGESSPVEPPPGADGPSGDDTCAASGRCHDKLSTREAPVQAFSWCDLLAEPGSSCEYMVCPVYRSMEGELPEVRESAGASVRVQLEVNGAGQRHEVWFNRGTAGSQAYLRRFGSVAPENVPGDGAWAWLSRGLGEALLDFVGRAKGSGWMLRGAFYEFTWPPALVALAAASARGVDVRIVVDCGEKAPRRPLLDDELRRSPGAATGGRVDLHVPYRQKEEAKRLGARWDPRAKVWYAPLAQPELLAKWGCPKKPPPKDEAKSPLLADAAIDAVPGLRDLVLRRECSGGISHNKFLVLVPPDDGEPSVWTGSMNLTQSAVYGQSNSAHVVNADRAVGEAYLEYWGRLASDAALRELAEWNATQTPDSSLPGLHEEEAALAATEAASTLPTDVQVVFCPRPSCALLECYARALAAARRCACITAAFGVNKKLADVLSRDNGALRYVLLEKKGTTYDAFAHMLSNRVACGALLGPGVLDEGLDEAARQTWSEERLTGLNEHVQFVHNKFMLVDPLGPRPLVLTGSANFSQASVQKNDENILFVRGDTRLSDMYFVEFWRMFKHWSFRDYASQRADERRAARKEGKPPPRQLDLHLADDDSWVEAYYDPARSKCQEREMLLAMHVPSVAQSCSDCGFEGQRRASHGDAAPFEFGLQVPSGGLGAPVCHDDLGLALRLYSDGAMARVAFGASGAAGATEKARAAATPHARAPPASVASPPPSHEACAPPCTRACCTAAAAGQDC